jgi:hypothetical protein
VSQDRVALRAGMARLRSSARRLPGRLAHAAEVALQILRWTATFRLRAGLRQRREIRLVRNSDLFDPHHYLSRFPDDAAAQADPASHYVHLGAARGLDPSPLFDGAAYLARNPAAACENPLAHFLRTGGSATRSRAADAPGPGAPAARAAALRDEPLETAAARVRLDAPGSGAPPPVGDRPSVLVVGVYLCDRENHAVEIARELGRSRRWDVQQSWIALGSSALPEPLRPITAWRQERPLAKFVLVNRLLARLGTERHAFVLVCDDDILLPEGFVDAYLELVSRHDLALAQPARTHDSYTDNWIVQRLDGLAARRTRFVEIGPLFSMRRDAARLLVPFDETSPMGWGYDFVWPLTLEEAGLRLGIVDATPIAHNLRKPVAFYDDREAAAAMKAYLARRWHLSPRDAFTILEAYP